MQSRFGLAVRRQAVKRTTSVRFLASGLLSLQRSSGFTGTASTVPLSLTVTETLKQLSSLPILMQNYSGADGVAFYAYTGAFVRNSQ